MEMLIPQNNIINEMKHTSALKNRRIYFSDEVDRNSIFEVIYYLDRIIDLDIKYNLKKQPIEIVIDSYGGVIYNCNTLISKLEYMKEKLGYYIITTVSGVAMSAGFMISLLGSERRAYRYSTFLLHQPSFGAYGTLQDVQDEVTETQRLWNLMKIIVKKYTKLTDKELEEMKHSKKDWIFDAEQCLEKGIIDTIL